MVGEQSFIYLDHAATSWPKAPGVVEAVTNAMLNDSANPGRGSHAMAVRASRILFQTRKNIAKLFRIKNPNDIAFCNNTTMALNLAIKGLLQPEDHVITTSVEHNSVRRPLYELEQTIGINVSHISADEQGFVRVDDVNKAITSKTKLLVINHSSNLLGAIQPLEALTELAKKNGIRVLVDAAQSAGLLPIEVEALRIDMLAFPGHKGLLGPQGTGGLYIAPDLDLKPLLHGGTGSQSETPYQPTVRPDRYEAGTQNTAALAGLGAGVQYILDRTVQAIGAHEWQLSQRMMEGLLRNNKVRLLGPQLGKERTGIVSFVIDGIDPSEAAHIFDQHYNIAVRSGYHCTPGAHQTAHTSATGAVRASAGAFTTDNEADALVDAVHDMIKQYGLG